MENHTLQGELSKTVVANDPLSSPTHPLGSTGLTAVAIYDYQKQDDDEISFDPDDIITNIDQVKFLFNRQTFLLFRLEIIKVRFFSVA